MFIFPNKTLEVLAQHLYTRGCVARGDANLRAPTTAMETARNADTRQRATVTKKMSIAFANASTILNIEPKRREKIDNM